MIISKIQQHFIQSCPDKSFGQLLDVSQKIYIYIYIYISKKLLIQNFHILKYGLLIKILSH